MCTTVAVQWNRNLQCGSYIHWCMSNMYTVTLGIANWQWYLGKDLVPSLLRSAKTELFKSVQLYLENGFRMAGCSADNGNENPQTLSSFLRDTVLQVNKVGLLGRWSWEQERLCMFIVQVFLKTELFRLIQQSYSEYGLEMDVCLLMILGKTLHVHCSGLKLIW